MLVVTRRAGDVDRPAAERLWLMFRHDMSEFQHTLPNPDGTFRSGRLDRAFCEADWAVYLMTSGEHPVGLAVVRGLTSSVRVLNSFFVVRAARGKGVALRSAREIVGEHPGHWEVAFQDANTSAVHFWRRLATCLAGEEWTEEHRPVPARPDLPPDRWISFSTV